METENATITEADLGVEDHGIFTCFITLTGDGWGQGFGGYALDKWDEAQHKRIGTAHGMDFIKGIMDTFGVSMWSELRGKHCRVERDGKRITRIGHITKNRWFDPKAIFTGRAS